MTPNEWRETMNMAPLEGGDEPIRRLDTQVVNLVKNALGKMNSENCTEIAGIIKALLQGGEKNEAQNQCQRSTDTK